MAELFDVPKLFCAKGHEITGRQELIEKRRDGSVIITGYVNKSVLICETCAWEAGGGETLEGVHHRPAKGKRLEKLGLEKLGQESFLDTIPTKFIA